MLAAARHWPALTALAAALGASGCAELASREAPAADPLAGASAERGQYLVERLSCVDCHSPNAGEFWGARSFAELWGETLTLTDGSTVLVDLDYIRTSVLDPRAQVEAGVTDQMDTYAGRVSEDEIRDIAAYIRSLRRD